MKTSAVKSSTTSTHQFARNSKRHFFAEAGRGSFFPPSVQRKMNVGKPGDKFEQEADKMAGRVMRANAPETDPSSEKDENIRRQADERLQKMEEEQLQKQDDEKLQKSEEEKLQKEEQEKLQQAPEPEKEIQRQEEEKKLQRKEAGTTGSVSSSVQSVITGNMTGGEPLSNDVRSFMEPRFNADFSNIRIHSDREAASLNNQLSARAFTYRNHIFFSRDQYQPGTSEGKHLLAHELTHTIQQGHAVQRSPQITTSTTPPQVQRLGLQDALDYFAERAAHIPGFRMLTVVIGFNPINQRQTERSASNILRALVEIAPGGRLITQALDNHGVINRAEAWVEQQLTTLGDIGSGIVRGLRRFLDPLSWRDIFNLGNVWNSARDIFSAPIRRLTSFAVSVARELLRMVKETILRPLARMAEGTRGYDLLKAVLGQDPITGEPVPRNAETLIGGFMRLIGQEEVWRNIQRGNAVARAWAWFQGALSGLMGFVRSIPQQIIQTLTSITWQDVLSVAGVFARVGRTFLNIAGSFISWAGRQVFSLLEIVFSVVAPGAMPYLRRVRGAFRSIIQNPISFVRNLVNAGIQGFRQFARNILRHLRASLIGWLTGTMSSANIYIPQSFSLREILKFVLSVLGLTWQNIRRKLVRAIGERAVRALETGFELVRTLVTEGPAAAWRQILEGISNFRDMVMEQIMNFVQTRVVQAAVTRIVAMLTPAGAFIQAIIAIYNTIMFFVERLRQIAQVAMAFINSIISIASGNITAAANRVEQTMAGLLTLVISFLARFAGLGNVARAVTNIINRVRRPIDRALDRVVAWIVRQARRLGQAVARAGLPQDPRQRAQLGMRAAVVVVNRLPGNRIREALIPPVLRAIKIRYGFRRLYPTIISGRWWIVGSMSPENRSATQKSSDNASNSAAAATLPDQVQILSANNAIMISNYSRSARTGTLQSGIYSGSITLNKLKHAPQEGQTGDQTVDAPGSTTVEYTISSANSLYGTPGSFQAVDQSDPDEAERYKETREAFPEIMRNWWRKDPSEDAARIAELHSQGLVAMQSSQQELVHGTSKWHFLYSQLTNDEKNLLHGPINKENMSALLGQLSASRRDRLGEAWKRRWSQGTQIHHIKPINFGGDNQNFIPLSAEKHVGGSGVHPRFWTPLKRFLMGLR